MIGYNPKSKEIYISHNANGNISEMLRKTTINFTKNKIKLKILLDKSSLEVSANDGEKVITTRVFPDKDATQFSLFAAEAM